MPKYEIRECKKHGQHKHVFQNRGYFRCCKCMREAVARRRRKIKLLAVTHAGGKCSKCGYDRCIAALDFHHLDPKEKSFGISNGGFCRSLEKTLKEVQKCVLVCANCHREIEYELQHSGVG